MSNPLALVLRQSPTPDEMYRQSFAYFQGIFRSRPQADVSNVNLFAFDLPEGIRGDRTLMGTTIDGALIAILDHETQCGILAPVPDNFYPRLDEIIITQSGITGAAVLASDLVATRASEWERSDYRKYKRWLKALDKAARIHQRITAAPLDLAHLPEVKRRVVEELRPVVARLRERFAKERVLPGKNKDADSRLREEILAAFSEEIRDADAPFLAHEHNRQLLLQFYRRDPVAYWHLSAERLFDEFTAFVTTHDAEYVRKKISSLK